MRLYKAVAIADVRAAFAAHVSEQGVCLMTSSRLHVKYSACPDTIL